MGFLLGVIEFGVFMGLPLVALVWIYVFWITANYFFEVVEFRAFGHDGWPVFSMETLVAGRNQVGLAFAVLVLLAAGAYAGLAYSGSDALAEMLLALVLIVYPASVALLAVTRNFMAALNPMRLVATVAALGSAYLYCLLASIAVFVLLRFALLSGGLWYLALIYALLLQAYLIGSIVYARRSALGLNVSRSPEAREQRICDAKLEIRSNILNQAYGFAAHGNLRGALKHVQDYIDTEDDSLEARLWVLHQASRWEERSFVLAFGKRVIDYCEKHELAGDAARVRAMCASWQEMAQAGDRSRADL